MLEVIGQPGCEPFVVAILLMLALLMIEVLSAALGLGVSEAVEHLLPDALVDPAVEADVAPNNLGRALGWLHIGKVPLLMILVCFLTSFGLVGWVGQSLMYGISGYLLPAGLASPLAFLASLPPTRWAAGILVRLMPKDETSAVSLAGFVGATARVSLGDATIDRPAGAVLSDRHGQRHNIRVIPDVPGDTLSQDEHVLLVAQVKGALFRAIPVPNSALIDKE